MYCKPIDEELSKAIAESKAAIRRAEKLLKKLQSKAWVQIAQKSHYIPDDSEPNVMEVRLVSIRLTMHCSQFRAPALYIFEHVGGEDTNYQRVIDLLPIELMRVHDALPELIEKSVNESVLVAKQLQAKASELNRQMLDIESNPIFQDLLS